MYITYRGSFWLKVKVWCASEYPRLVRFFRKIQRQGRAFGCCTFDYRQAAACFLGCALSEMSWHTVGEH